MKHSILKFIPYKYKCKILQTALYLMACKITDFAQALSDWDMDIIGIL